MNTLLANAGKAFRYEPGEPVLTYIGVKARTQLGDFGTATLGRIVKGEAKNGAGAPTVLADPTPEDLAKAQALLSDFDPSQLSYQPRRNSEPEVQEAPAQAAPVITPERTATPPWKVQG